MVTPTIDGFLAASANGQYQSTNFANLSVSSAPTVSGTTGARRGLSFFTIPTLGGSVTGGLTTITSGLNNNAACGVIHAQEINFGTYTFGTGWSGTGTTMPTKTIQGSSIQTASPMLAIAVTSNVTATTPTITITYTNQAGTASQSMTYVLPTNSAVTSAYILNSFLASGDVGVRAVSNVSSSAGSAGTFQLFGCLPISMDGYSASPLNSPVVAPNPQFQFAGGEQIGFYSLGQIGNNNPNTFTMTVIGG